MVAQMPQMEPTDQLDAPNRRPPESRVKRFANAAEIEAGGERWHPSPVRKLAWFTELKLAEGE